jgi:hypothetical protein
MTRRHHSVTYRARRQRAKRDRQYREFCRHWNVAHGREPEDDGAMRVGARAFTDRQKEGR